MLKLVAKIAEKYAKSTNTACWFIGMFHQPKIKLLGLILFIIYFKLLFKIFWCFGSKAS